MRLVHWSTTAIFFVLVTCGWTLGAKIQVCFSPPLPAGCDPTDTIVQAISSARKQIRVQAYEFTSASIAKGIIDAQKRGVDVRVILDKSNLREGYSAAKFLEHEGVPVLIDSAHAIAHNKVIVIDGETVVTGSFNFTKSAEERNAENVVIIRDPAVAELYLRNWNSHATHSIAVGPEQGGAQRVPSASVQSRATALVVGNRRSRIYAWPGCSSYDTMSAANRVEFPSREAAEAAGYRQARNCP